MDQIRKRTVKHKRLAVSNISMIGTCKIVKEKKRKALFINKNVIRFPYLNLLVAYLASWTPYAVVSLQAIISDGDLLNPIIRTVSALIAKTSLVWPAIICLLTNKEMKETIKIRIRKFRNNMV